MSIYSPINLHLWTAFAPAVCELDPVPLINIAISYQDQEKLLEYILANDIRLDREGKLFFRPCKGPTSMGFECLTKDDILAAQCLYNGQGKAIGLTPYGAFIKVWAARVEQRY